MAFAVHGTAMHFFSAHSDKFYRAFYYRDNTGGYTAVYHWGRDGARGQLKTDSYRSLQTAERAVERKVNEKLNKGYQFLGRAIIVADPSHDGLHHISDMIASKTGRTPTKHVYLIFEVYDLDDLVAELTS